MFKQYRRKQIAELRSVTQKDIDLYKIPYKVYQCNSLARMQDKNGSNTLHVVLEDITPSADNDTFDREKIVVELNQFVNTWNPYVEPKEEIKDEVGEVHD